MEVGRHGPGGGGDDSALSPSAYEIERLLADAQAGDVQARDALFARCRGYLTLVARTRLQGWMQGKIDSSDLVQQTLLDAYRGFDQFRGRTRGEWLAWLRRILDNRAADAVRAFQGTAKRRSSREVSLDQPGVGAGLSNPPRYEPVDDGDSPSAALQRVEDQLALADAIEQLAPDYREVIILRNFQRRSFSEIAEIMGRTRPAVQMLWMRAVRTLQAILAERFGGA